MPIRTDMSAIHEWDAHFPPKRNEFSSVLEYLRKDLARQLANWLKEGFRSLHGDRQCLPFAFKRYEECHKSTDLLIIRIYLITSYCYQALELSFFIGLGKWAVIVAQLARDVELVEFLLSYELA
jgi:hypothetical protein